RAAGIYAVSMPTGASSSKWIDECWDWLNQFETIYLSFDWDNAGQDAVQKIAGRLGTYKCKKVILTEKDANDVLVNDPTEFKEKLELAIFNAVDVTPNKFLNLENEDKN